MLFLIADRAEGFASCHMRLHLRHGQQSVAHCCPTGPHRHLPTSNHQPLHPGGFCKGRGTSTYFILVGIHISMSIPFTVQSCFKSCYQHPVNTFNLSWFFIMKTYNMKFTILTFLKCTVQWHYHSHCCANITTIMSRTSSSSPVPIKHELPISPPSPASGNHCTTSVSESYNSRYVIQVDPIILVLLRLV